MLGILRHSGIPNVCRVVRSTPRWELVRVNHHIVSRGRDAASTARRDAWRGSECAPAARCTIKHDISRPIYITRERALLHVGLLYVYVYTSRTCAAAGYAPSSSFRYPLREIIRAYDEAYARRNVPIGRTVHYIGILSGVDRRASAGSDYHLGHFPSRRTIGD